MPRAVLAIALVLLVAGVAWTTLGRPDPGPLVPAGVHGFRVAPAERAARVWAIGDGADGSARTRRVADLVVRENPDAVLYLGDVYESGTADEFERKVRGPYRRLLGRMLPTPGNHEWPRHAEGYDPFWKSVTGVETASWYATTLAGWELISLNSETRHDAGSPQVRWLRRRLADRGTCRIAFWHRPRFSAGEHGDHPDTQPFWDALRGKAVLVLSGHDHNLQRFAPRDGLVQIVSGAGGRERYRVDEGDPRLEFGDDDHHGGLRMTLHAERADLEFVTSDGEVLDSSSVRCRPR
jgi:hypothetical protein